ncbi:MAG: hypothetical protein V1874_12945 [Spirochaetota bacterium]
MKCEKAIADFINQDDSRYPAFLIRMHIAFCSKCRKEVREMQKAFVLARTTSPFVMSKDITESVMLAISKSDMFYGKNISSAKWISTGSVIFASIFLVSYSDSLIWLKTHFGSVLEVPLFMVLGSVITAYAALYIGTHINGLKRFVKFIESWIH